MAITRAQQARQMYRDAGFVVQDGFKNYIKDSESVTVPKEFKSKGNATPTKLAYITSAEAKQLKKENPGTPHKGPKGIPSYDDFDAETGSFRSGATMSAAESGKNTSDTLAAGMSGKDVQNIRSSVIAAGAGQRVNPGFFDSRNVVSPEELRLARQFAKTSPFAKGAMRRTRGGGLSGFLTSGGFLGNLIRGLGQRVGLGKRFDQPTYDMRGLASVNPNNLDIYNEFVDDEDDTTVSPNIIVPRRKPDAKILLEDENYDEQLGDIRDIMAADGGRIGAQEGGNVVGGEFDFESARQMYGLGKLVKKVTRSVKKIAKSPIGKAALLYAGTAGLGALGAGAARAGTGLGIFAPSNVLSNVGTSFLRFKASPIGESIFGRAVGDTDMTRSGGLLNFIKDNPFITMAGVSTLAGVLTPEQEKEAQLLADNTGIDIEAARNSILNAGTAKDFRARAFVAEGCKPEPVAKKTMPLLDMGGNEMDLRAEGGFVPIGRMEKADDVPARLSKNEFVFTADAVRNAGDGDVDKGAEVMYNMMKNLEAGGEVSEESQGLEGARKMFQTSQRLEEVL